MTRIGASQAFFNIVAQFNAEKLIKDTTSLNTVMKAVSLDTFEAILKPIDDMIMQMDNAINAVSELGMGLADATVEFEKFYGESANIESLKDELIEIGHAYAIVGTEALAAGSRAAQVGNIIGRQNIMILVEQAAILAEISDLTHEEAQRGLIQLNQQAGVLYGDMTRQQLLSLSAREQQIVLNENAARTLDVLNTVANRSVALEGDLVKTMTNFASGAKLAGDSFEFMAAASATLLEAGEEQGTAGRALRMMYARLGGDINGARTKVEALGFSFSDQNGQMKNMQGILQELHDKGWAQLNPAMKQNIAQTIAGNRHYVRFIKLMENFGRITDLAADAELRLDSASEQANKALQSQVRLLQQAEVDLDNVKAAIGEGLMPFQTAMKQEQVKYLQTVEMLTDGMGEFGRAAGRFMGIFKITEGFLKFGIAIQSIGVGLEMFSSVQRSLQGVEIAVSNLHSKQAAYKDFNVKMTKDEAYLVQGMLHHQQILNRANKEIQLAKMLMVDSDKQLTAHAERRAELQERIAQRNTDILVKRHELIAIEKQRLDTARAEDSMYGKRAARIEYENQTGRALLQTQKDIYTQKMGAEDAYMRQMLADFDVFGKFNEEERRVLRDKNERLREQHTLLQQIKAENEAVRALRRFDPDTGIEMDSVRQENALKMSERERNIMLQAVDAMRLKTERARAGLKITEKSTQQQQDFANMLDVQIAKMGALGDSLRENETDVNLSKDAYDGLMLVIKDVNGEYMQTERSLRIITAAEADAIKEKNKYMNITMAIGKLEKAAKADKGEMISLGLKDYHLKQKVAPLLEIINNAEAERAHQAEAMTQLIRLLTAEEDKQLKILKQKQAALYKGSEQFKKDEQRMAAARRSMFISMSNLAGLSAGLFRDSTAQAAASAAMMGTQLIFVAGGAVKSATELIKVQYGMYATQFAAEGATDTMVRFKAATMAAAKALAPILAIGGLFYLFAKHSEMMSKNVQDFNDSMMETEALMGRFSATTKLFSDEGLAKTLGITNYEMKDLKDNGELVEEVMDKLNNHGLSLSDNLQKSVDETINLLHALEAVQQKSGLINESMFESRAADLYAQETNFGRFFTRFGSDLESIQAFYDENFLNFEFDPLKPASEVAEGFIVDLIDIMRSGYKLSERDLELVENALGGQVAAQIRAMNSLVMTYDMANYYNNSLEASITNTTSSIGNQASEIENLTNEIYNFGNAREELFFGGKYGNVTGSLYKQVVTQGVGTLYHKNEIIMSNNFHGFFNEREAAAKIIAVLDEYIATGATA